MNRIAGAPISWGVCEVPGWGYQLGPQKVLTEMREVGLAATELGPDGFLPADPAKLAAVLDEYGLQAVGGFTPSSVVPTQWNWSAPPLTASPTPTSKTCTPNTPSGCSPVN
jgi:hypothetical protein